MSYRRTDGFRVGGTVDSQNERKERTLHFLPRGFFGTELCNDIPVGFLFWRLKVRFSFKTGSLLKEQRKIDL